jgi:pyrimidine deaminase RibD-like protein
MNFHDLDNFNLADAVKFHSRLNPRIWGSDEHLLPEVQEKLLAIAADFQEFLGVDDLKVQDLTISGSNAAYSYTPHSDIDLHLVVEMPDDPVYQELFNAKKYQYNDEHDIRIGGVPVELYVQPADQKHVSQGIYSIKNNDWNQVPQRRRAQVDDSCVQNKAADLDARIHAAVKSGDGDAINRLWDRIKDMRKTGLEKNGEFGCENITFKLLRNMGCIGRLKDAKTAIRDRELSLEQSKKPRKRVNYGMRDYWYPGTAYAGQDHPAGTESEQIDEAVGGPRIVVVGDSIALGIAQAAGLPHDAVVGRSTKKILSAAASNPAVQGADVAIVSAGTNDYPIRNGGVNPNPDATINNISGIRDALNAKKYVWILPFNRNAAQDVMSAISGDAHVDLAAVATPDREGLHPKEGYGALAKAALSRSIREDITESVDPDHLKKILHRFYKSCVSKLKLKNPPRLRLETTPDWSRENGSFGQYEPESNTLILATYGRHVLDILRTMAHEMTHRQQDEREPLPADAGATGSPYEDQANAMAGRIMRQWAEEQPEMFDGVTLEEASGYIPTKKQARDPRFVMALTRDVRPGAVGKEANKLGLQTDSQGHPALLTAGLQKLLREFKEQDLFEINMGGKNLRKEAAKTGALAGMEFEMIVPNTQSEDDGDLEPDYDQDDRASSPRDIRDFFYDGDYNSRRSVDGLIDSMMNDFSEWQSEEFDTRWESDSEQMIYDYIKDNMDDDDVRGLLDLESEDPVGRNEYQLAADKITAEQIQPWYEDAQESAREEFYEDDDQFEEWLGDSGLTMMSDIERRYSGDITWPHYRSVSSGEGASVQETAESFSQAVGRPARASDSYHEYGQERPGPGKNFYVVEPDGSLEPDDSDDAGLEFVSPPLPIDEIMSDLNKVKKWADLNGCYTNSSTGLHINISVPNYDLDRLDFVKLALLMGDEYVLDQFGRVSNTYAKSAMKKVRDHVQKRPYEAKYLLDKMKGHMGELASKAIHSGSTEKYTSINTKDGHVEFRSPGGDWLGDNFSKIENTLLRFTVALSAAMDPKAYREEYLKKLYKILAPKDEKDPLAVFAKYAAGELPATALKSFVRQAQADRKAKKSGEAIVNGHRWRVSLKPELGGGVVEVTATDPIDAKKQAIIQQPNWRFVDDSALTITRLDEPAAGASTTEPHPQGRGRPNDPNGRLAIVNRDDPRVFAYSSGTPSPAPNYLFRFTLPDGYSQAQLRAVMAAWAARENANAADYMVVDTTQFLAPAAPEAGSVQWNIINRNNETVHTFWNRNVQADANAAAHEWLTDHRFSYSVDGQGPFDVVPAAIPGSTIDLQRQRQAADVAANTRRWADYEASQAATPTPVPGVQDIDIEIPPAQTQWEVYDRNTDQPVFRMYAENQAAAWRKGQEWVANYARMTPGQPIYGIDYSVRQSTAPVSESITVLEQRLRSELDALGNQPPTGPETPPKMPAGTIKVDVSDMYDWYKLGQHISNLKGIDKSTLGTGPPHTVFAFGSEELENKYSHELTNLGLKTHDLDEPGEEDVDESQEITKLGKLDSVLEKCIDMIRRGHETDPEKYGRVAACLIDNKNNHTYAINMPGPNGTRRHAERMAIDRHLKSHGRIGPNAIMITTLSPCVRHMDERDGESCTDLLSDYGIEKCYAGWQDPTQHPAEDYPFNLQVTDNADIFNTCKDIAASFLPQTVAEGTEQITWIKPNFDYEWDEIEFQAKQPQVPEDVRSYMAKHFPNKDAWLTAVQNGKAVVVPPDHGQKIRNYTDNKKDLLNALSPESHDPHGPAKAKRVNALFDKGGPIEMPIILKTSKGLWLIGGKTRLGTANLLKGIPAKVWMIGGKKNVDEAYTGPPMKFLKPGELSGGYSPQQMQAMGFKQTANGTWYIPVNTWQRLVSGGQIREGAAGPLASMVSQDQAERNEYKQFVQSKAGGDWDKGAQMYAQLKGRPSDDIFGDSANQDRFMKMTFDFDTFTEDDWHNYWLMAQHCDKNRDFQRQALAAIEKYQGQDHQNYHYLADRISCGTTGTQKYGTQNGCNIDSVNENFADGRHPEDKGDSKRHHVPTKSSVSNLRRFAKSHSGRAAQLAHWMANMKAGRAKKKKKTNEDSEFVDTISPGFVADWDDQAGQIRYTKNNVVIPYGTAEYNAARAQHVEYRKNLKYNKLKQTTDPIYDQIRGAFEKEQQSPTKPGAAIVVPQELFPQDKIKPPVKYDDPTDDDFVAEDYESMVEAVDQQTVDRFTTRANGVRETIARNADPQYQKAIRNIPIRIMNGNTSNRAFAQGGTLNIDAEEWYNAPDEVLLLVMGHEVGHILFKHDTRPAGTVVPIQQDQQEEYDGDDFALEIAQKLGIKKIPIWTWLHRHKNDLEAAKQRQRANPPGPWPTYDDRSERALRRRGVTLSQANTDQIDHAIQQLEHLA